MRKTNRQRQTTAGRPPNFFEFTAAGLHSFGDLIHVGDKLLKGVVLIAHSISEKNRLPA